MLSPEERRGQMDRIERAQLGRQRPRGAGKYRSGDVDDFEALNEPEHRLPPPRQLAVRKANSKAKTVEGTEALRFDQRAYHPGADGSPLAE